MDESNLNTVVCNYCGQVTKGGVTRAKEYLMANKGDVAACTKTPKNVREELWKLYKEKKDSSSVNPRYNIINDNHKKEDKVEISMARKDRGRNNGGRKGPMDMFCKNLVVEIEKQKKKGKNKAN